MTRKYFSKNNPRPKPVGYTVDPNRKLFPPHLFDEKNNNAPRPRAMEDYRDRYYHYPEGVTPIYENDDAGKEVK